MSTLSADESFRVSKALTLQLDPRGFWMGTHSVSRTPQELADDALPVLAAFARPKRRDAALEALSADWEVDPAEFDAMLNRLLELGFLTPQNGAAPSLASGGFAQVLPHFFMIRDSVRVAAYRGAIERHVQGRSVVEIGCGSGILSLFAARAGARRVTAIEESEIATVARRMFEANGCTDLIDLRLGNSRDIDLEAPADIIIHEILGTDPLAENVLVYLDDARRRLLKPGGRLLPHRLEIACVGVELEEPPALDRERALLETRQFAAAYGLNFDPMLEELERTPSSRFPRPLSFPLNEPFPAPILTAETRLFDLDLEKPLDPDLGRRRRVRLTVQKDGRLGAVLLFFHAHLDEQAVLSTSPYAPPTHWGWDVRVLSKEVEVQAGTDIELSVDTDTRRGLQRVSIDWP